MSSQKTMLANLYFFLILSHSFLPKFILRKQTFIAGHRNQNTVRIFRYYYKK